MTAQELTPREREVLVLAAQALPNKEIGERLGISERTVETHMQNAQNKLGLRNRVAAVVWAFKQGLVSHE